MKYKLNIPKFQFYFSIQKTIDNTRGPDTFLSVSQIISFIIFSIIIICAFFFYFINWELPDSGTKYRILFLILLAFIYSITHKKNKK